MGSTFVQAGSEEYLAPGITLVVPERASGELLKDEGAAALHLSCLASTKFRRRSSNPRHFAKQLLLGHMARTPVPPERDDRGPEHQTLMPAVGDVLHLCLHSAVQHVLLCSPSVSYHCMCNGWISKADTSLVAIEHRLCSKYIAAFHSAGQVVFS